MRKQCGSCASANVTEVIFEICIHFPGLDGLKIQPIYANPKAVVCMDCGFTGSTLSKKELEQVQKAAAGTNEFTATNKYDR